jgi:hypothetical protein
MGDLFGGFLSIFNVVGGGILYLLIGSKAQKENESGRHYRLSAGSISIGLILGVIIYFMFFENVYGVHRRDYVALILCLACSSIALLVVVRFLESIRKDIGD